MQCDYDDFMTKIKTVYCNNSAFLRYIQHKISKRNES